MAAVARKRFIVVFLLSVELTTNVTGPVQRSDAASQRAAFQSSNASCHPEADRLPFFRPDRKDESGGLKASSHIEDQRAAQW